MTNLTDAILSSQQTSAVVRTGVVTDWSPTQVQLNVGGTLIYASFLDWYQPPIVGDLVAVIRQDSSWLVLGRYAGAGVNLILNPSFEDAEPAAGVPLNWFSFTTIAGLGVGAASVSVITDTDAPQSGQAAQMLSGGVANDVVLTSSPVSVNPGESYFISAYVTNFGFVPSAGVTTPPHQAQIMACWFSTDVEAFPSGTLADDYTMVDRRVNLRESPPYTFVSGAVTVPAGVPSGGVLRVGLRATFIGTDTSAIRWDYITCRRSA